MQVNAAVGMSLVVEGDSAVDKQREICMISTFCCKLSVSCIVVVLLLLLLLEVFPRPSLLPAGRDGFKTLL